MTTHHDDAAAVPRYDEVEVGHELPELSVHITRADLVRYAGASGDFNMIHWSDRVATEVGLDGVIAHGMLTMAQAARVVTDWAGPAAVAELSVRFAKPVLVPDDDRGAEVVLGGRVAEKRDAERLVRVDLTATCAGERILSGARALVRLD